MLSPLSLLVIFSFVPTGLLFSKCFFSHNHSKKHSKEITSGLHIEVRPVSPLAWQCNVVFQEIPPDPTLSKRYYSPRNIHKLLAKYPKDHFRNHISVLGMLHSSRWSESRWSQVCLRYGYFSTKKDKSPPLPPQRKKFLIVHYCNYILYTKDKIYQKEKTSGTCLYFL